MQRGSRLVDFGVYIAGGIGTPYAPPQLDGQPVQAGDWEYRHSHEPHGFVQIEGNFFSQYGFTAPNPGADPLDAGALSLHTWSTRNSMFSVGIHVSCAKEIRIRENIVTAEMAWTELPWKLTHNATDEGGFYVNNDGAAPDSLREHFNSVYAPTAAFVADTAAASIFRVVKFSTKGYTQDYSGNSVDTNTLYVGPARVEYAVNANSAATSNAVHIPLGYTGQAPTAAGGFPLYMHPDFGKANPHASINLSGDYYCWLGHFNFWRAGVEVSTRPATYMGFTNPDPLFVPPNGASAGSRPHMHTNSYTGQQNVDVSGNSISFIYRRGISVLATMARVSRNTLSTFCEGGVENLFYMENPTQVLPEDFKDVIYVRASRKIISGNICDPGFLGHNTEVDQDFQTYFIEHPALGGLSDPAVPARYIRTQENSLASNYQTTTAPFMQDTLGPTVSNRFTAVVSENTGCGIHAEDTPVMVVNNFTEGGDIIISATADGANPAETIGFGHRQAVLINGNVLSAGYANYSGSIIEEYYSALSSLNLLSAIVTDNNLQSVHRVDDGGVSTDGEILGFAPPCIVADNLPSGGVEPEEIFLMNAQPRLLTTAYSGGSLTTDPSGSHAHGIPHSVISSVGNHNHDYLGVNTSSDGAHGHGSTYNTQNFDANGFALTGLEGEHIHSVATGAAANGIDALLTAMAGVTVLPSCFSGTTGPFHVHDDAANSMDQVVDGAAGNSALDVVSPSMWTYGNSFRGGIFYSDGVCVSAGDTTDGFSNFGTVDAGDHFALNGYYSVNIDNTFILSNLVAPNPGGESFEDANGTVIVPHAGQKIFERRPFWLITRPPQRFSLSQNLAAQVFTTEMVLKGIPVGQQYSVDDIVFSLKWVKEYFNAQGLGWGVAWGLPEDASLHDGSSAPNANVLNDGSHCGGSTGGSRATFGVRAFIRRQDGTTTEIGQFVAHNMHVNLVRKGTVDGSALAGASPEEEGVFLTNYLEFDGSPCHETGAIVTGTNWLNSGKVPRQVDGYNRDNLGMRHFFHDVHDSAGVIVTPPNVSAPPNARTAAAESCWNNGTVDVGLQAPNTNAVSRYISSGSIDENNNYLDDGWVDAPLSIRLREFTVENGLGAEVDRSARLGDVLEFRWHFVCAPINSAIFDVRIAAVKVKYGVRG